MSFLFLLLAPYYAWALVSGPLSCRAQSAMVGALTASTIDIPIDHFNASDTRTYQNRYWVNSTYYKQGGPVFFADNGEAGLSNAQASAILSGPGNISVAVELAQKYSGIAILWEHRFYGQSLPFEVDNTTGLALAGFDAYKYLTNEQALEDAVYFAQHFSLPGYADNLSSNSTPWIWIGGSYPGIRAAMIRQRNPDVFFASWASSAPVQTVVASSVYFNTIQQAMPANCSADVHAAVTFADHVMTHGSSAQISLLRRALYLTNAVNPATANFSSAASLTYWDIGQILAYPFQASFVAFQSYGYTQALGGFCDQMEMWNPSNFTNFTMTSPASDLANSEDANFTSSGVASTYGVEAALYAYLHAIIQKGISDYRISRGASRSPIDSASWWWQLCTQFAQFQVSNPSSPTNLISRFDNLTSTESTICHQMFPYAPAYPDIDAILKYGGWDMKPSNVMWAVGEEDPWRALTVEATTKINPQALNRPSSVKVPKCNTPPPGDFVFGQIYPNAGHGWDLYASPSAPAYATSPAGLGLALFGEALDIWLPCFGAA